MEETKTPRPWLNPAITQHARRDVWLDSLNYSHHRSLTAPTNDRFLSSSQRRAIRPTYMHLWHFSSKIVRRDDSQRSRSFEMCLSTHLKKKKKRFHSQHNSTPHYCDHFQMENLPRNAGCQQPTHGIGQICHHKNGFHWAQGKNM